MTKHEQPSSAGIDATAYTIEQTRITIDRLRMAYAWLRLLVVPGHESSTAVAVHDAEAERLEAIGRSDRAYRDWNLRRGMSALPPSPAAARIGIIDAQVLVHDIVAGAVHLLASTGNAATRARAERSLAEIPTALDWIGGVGVLLGLTGADGVWWRPGAIDRVRDAQLAADVDKALQRADRVARSAARVTGERVRPLEHRCPACRQRSLQLEYDGTDRRAWVVRCVSERCVCTGDAVPDVTDGCGCLQGAVNRGRRHAWPYGDLDGAGGLLAAIAGAGRIRQRIHTGAAGHGGWQSRDMGGAA